jgi:hypothetical protein
LAPIWPGHLLVLEDAARILALTGRTVGTVRDGNAVGGAHASEAPALHRAGKALTLGHALDIDHLAGDIMLGRNLCADIEQSVFGYAEFHDARLGLHFGLAEMAALRLGKVFRLGGAGAELDRDITVTIGLTASNHLNIFERQDGDGHVAAVFLEQAGHPIFFAITPVRMIISLYRGPRNHFRGRAAH